MSLFSYLWKAFKSPKPIYRQQPARVRLSVEALEDRVTPSVTVANGQLVITGDQPGASFDDTVTIDVNAQGGVYANLNGQLFSFNAGQITSTVVNTGAGSNSVYIINEAAGVPLTINDGGDDFVEVGWNRSAQGILGSVSLNSPANRTTLVIDDSLDHVGQTFSVNSTSVLGLAPAGVYFHANDLSYLAIYAGSGGNVVNVLGTPSTYNGTFAGYTWIQSGAGSDSVSVMGTAGGPTAGGLYLNGQNGQDNVYVGSGIALVDGHSLAGIKGFVDVFNSAGSTHLFVDDSADATRHTATLNTDNLTGLSAGTIYWEGTSSITGGVTYLEIFAGTAASTYTVAGTPSIYLLTQLVTGTGSDVVNITGTTGTLSVYNTGGLDNVHVGNGTLTNINGDVNISGSGATYLYVDDGSDTIARGVTLTANSLTGLSQGAILWAGGVTFLNITGSAAGSTYVVNDTPNLLYYTNLVTGYGNDTVYVTGTTGALYLNNLGGYDYVYIGSDGELTDINGLVNVSGAGSTYLYIEDGSDPNAHSATLTRTSLTGLSGGAIQWTASSAAMGGVTFLAIYGSFVGNTYTITDTPNFYYYTYLMTGASDDTVYITGTTGALYVYNDGGADTVILGRQAPATSGGKVGAIKGFVDIYGAGTVALTVDDSGDTNGRGATLASYSLTGLSTVPIYFDTNLISLTINGGNGNDTLTLASTPTIPVTFTGGNGNDKLVGPNTSQYWVITGIGAGNVDGNVNFANVENLVGGTDVDTFWFEPGARLTTINGGGAAAGQGDWLDYADYPAAVTVNLATAKATGVTGSISNIQNVFGGNHGNTLTGSAQGNILIGGDGADTLIGGSGRSLLVGGNGNDTIVGGAADDIIIGGSTAYSSAWHEAALMDLLARWQSADSYATRVNTLRTTWHPLVLGTTVFDDGSTDKLTGGGGMDWFFAATQDTIIDRQVGETVN